MKDIEGGLLFASLADGIIISNQMAKHRSAVSILCRAHNVVFACNSYTGGSSSLHKRMNAAARLMQPLRCAATHLKTSKQLLQHASNTQRTQALTRQAQRTAQHARRCSRTCTLLTQLRVTRSITNSAQLHVLLAMCVWAGAVDSRLHAIATQRKIERTGTNQQLICIEEEKGQLLMPPAKMEAAKGGSACC